MQEPLHSRAGVLVMGNRIVFTFAVMLFLLAPLIANAAINPSNIPVVASIAALQALGPASPQYATVAVTGVQGGNLFTWVAGSLPCNASTGGGDGGTTFCASNGSGGYLTSGYWHRQYSLSYNGGVSLNWFNGVDPVGVTDSSTGWGLALASAKALAVAHSGVISPVLVLGSSGAAYKLNSGFGTIDSYLTGINGNGALFNLSGISSSAKGMTVDSSTANPNYPRIFLSNMTILGPSGGAPGTTGIGIYVNGTSGVVGSIQLENISVLGFHEGVEIGSSAFGVNMHHSNLFENDDGLFIPSGTSDSGENISLDAGSVVEGNTRYAVNSQNPNADWHVVASQIDYNQTSGAATDAQVLNIDSQGSISDSHLEDFTHPVDNCTSSTSTPNITLAGNQYVRATGAASHLIDAGSGCGVSINGGNIDAAVSPQTTIGASAGGFMNVMGLTIGSAAFDPAAGTYYVCATGSTSCSTNRQTNSSLTTTANIFYAVTGYAVGSLPAGTIGEFSWVTDANATCTKNSTPTGGGSTKCPVWYNGSAWVEY